MSKISEEASKTIDPAISNVIRQAITILKEASAEELGDIQTRLTDEQNRRLENAERELESMRKVFGRTAKHPSGIFPAPRPTSKKKIPARLTRPKSTKAKFKPQGIRAPRGQSRETILTFLQDGPKHRQQIAEHFKESGLASGSISTLLNRLKKSNDIVYDEENKQYSATDKTKDESTT